MTEINMDAIRQRQTWVQDNADQCQRDPGQVSLSGYMAASIESSRDVPSLIAEVERLRAELDDRDAEAIDAAPEPEGFTAVYCQRCTPGLLVGADELAQHNAEHHAATRVSSGLAAAYHVTRSTGPSDLEAGCPCPKEPCGGVDTARANPDCDQHPASRSKTMRNIHRADQCPWGA